MRVNEVITESHHNFKTAYHITTEEFAAEIMYGGLDPHDGNAYLVVDQGDPAKLRKDLHTVAGWMLAKTENDDQPLTLLKIDITGIPLEKDYSWYVSKMPIPPERITDLGEGEFQRYAE